MNNNQTQKNISWTRVREESHKFGFRKLLKRWFIMPDGREARFDLTDPGSVVNVLAFTPDNKIIVAKQFRPGPEKLMYELPGGYVDEGEDTEVAAKRELLEETGYTPGRMEYIGSTYPDGYSTARRHRYIAYDCVKIAEPTPEQDEFLEVVLLTPEEFRAHAEAGESTDPESFYRFLLRDK